MAGATAYIPAALTVLSAFMGKKGADDSAEGSEVAGQGALRAAARTAAAKKFEAEQLRINAGQELAAGQAAGFEAERQGAIIASRQLALAAASGGGASSAGVVSLIAKTAKESSYRSAVAIYQGEDKARALRMAASGREYEAAAALEAGRDTAAAYQTKAEAYRTAGMANLITAGGSLFAKYGVQRGGNGDDNTVNAGSDPASWLDTGSVPGGIA